jgi:hypothetical protein
MLRPLTLLSLFGPRPLSGPPTGYKATLTSPQPAYLFSRMTRCVLPAFESGVPSNQDTEELASASNGSMRSLVGDAPQAPSYFPFLPSTFAAIDRDAVSSTQVRMNVTIPFLLGHLRISVRKLTLHTPLIPAYQLKHPPLLQCSYQYSSP